MRTKISPPPAPLSKDSLAIPQQIVSSLIPVLVRDVGEVVALAEEGLKFLALLHAGEGTGEIVVAVRWKRRGEFIAREVVGLVEDESFVA